MVVRLEWGGLSLVGESYPAGALFTVDAKADGTGFGNPEAVVTAVRSRLQNGSLASVASYDNRVGTVTVQVEADTYDGLAAGEAALMGQASVEGFNTLAWSPNAALARATVFDVVYAVLRFEFDDLNEVRLRRRFTVEFNSLPFGREETLTTVQATSATPPPAPTVVVVDSGSSVAGWSTGDEPAPGVSQTSPLSTNGRIFTQVQNSNGQQTPFGLRFTGTIDVSVTKYIYVDYVAEADVGPSGNLNGRDGYVSSRLSAAGGVEMTIFVVSELILANGLSRAYFQVPVGFPNTATGVVFNVGLLNGRFDGAFSIDQVVRTNVIEVTGTNRQKNRSLSIGGSAPAQASLAITASSGTMLGKGTLLYTRTRSTGFQPNLRPWLVSSATLTVDPAMVSGSRHTLGPNSVYRFPAARIRPAAHALVGLLRTATTGTYTITWSASLTSPTGTYVPEAVVIASGSTNVSMTADAMHSFFDIANIHLPPVLVASDSDRTITLTIGGPAGVIVDDFYLADLDNGVMSLLDTDGLTRLEVRTPNLESPEESVWGGYAAGGAATGLIRQDYRLRSLGQHVFPPGAVEVFTVTTGTEASALTAMYHRSYHSNVGAPVAA